MTDEQKIEAEKQELNLLVNRGVSFDVERTIYRRPKGLFGIFKKRIPTKEKLKFQIQEPTLSTLDRISSEAVEMIIDETIVSSDAGLSEARKLTNQHALRCAKIIALAVLGQDYMKTIQSGNQVKYIPDNKRLEELTRLFAENVKPSKLMQLTLLVNTMSNLGDFMNSIRLMSGARTTMPNRIEDNGV